MVDARVRERTDWLSSLLMGDKPPIDHLVKMVATEIFRVKAL